MNSYTLYPTPAPTPWDTYDRPVNGLHIDGIFWFMLCFASWVLFISAWAWNHKPKHRVQAKPEDWALPTNWRN